MKIWIILYTFSKVSGVIGPVPYDLSECNSRVTSLNQELVTKYNAYKGPPLLVKGRKIEVDSMKFTCFSGDKAPVIQYDDVEKF